MINVYGNVALKARFNVDINVSEEEFEAMSEHKQNELIDNAIDWHSIMGSAELDEIDVWEYTEVEPVE